MRLSSRSAYCWSSHNFSAMTGTRVQKLRNCESIDLSRFVVDLREDTWLEFRHPILMPTRAHSKVLTCNRWCVLPPKNALATRSPYSFPKYMFLDLPRVVIRGVACFRLHVHTLRFETITWNPRSSPTCDLCEADDDVQDEQHAIFHCTLPHSVSLRSR
jgi:hypothetical protein